MRRFRLSLIKPTFLVAVVYCALRYLASFSVVQGVVLAALALLFYGIIVSSAAKKSTFAPFSVFVKPQLLPILREFELMKDTDEAWSELRTGITKLPPSQLNIWNSGIAFSFLSQDLIYKNASNSFATEIDMYASLEPIAIGNEGAVIWNKPAEFEFNRPFTPGLNVRSAGHGHDVRITIELPDKHWDRLKERDTFQAISKTDVSVDQMCGTAEVLLAVIPWEEFRVHFSVMPGDSGKAFEDAITCRAETRDRYGWKGKSQTDKYERETTPDKSNVATHKYCEVSHSGL